ncbi:MAG TPA: hypothetical protein VFA10_17420 [Ktedonobacteraceae bacterium]|nr:hypothetical protein [Ktedonobacteraceae bacterium]
MGIFASGSLFCGLAPVIGNSDTSMQLIAPLQNIGVDLTSPGLVWLVVARFVHQCGQ